MEKYFVGSNGDEPDLLYFDLEEAQADRHLYIDSFNEKGIKVAVYKLDTEKMVYVKF